MPDHADEYWLTSRATLAELPGGPAWIEWFGGVPSFHDARLVRLEVTESCAILMLHAFRITDELDVSDRFVLDRHARVTIRLSEVTGIAMKGNASATLSRLGIRRAGPQRSDWRSCAGPGPNDFEVGFQSSYGLEGSIFARAVDLSLVPTES